jgi:glycosyltransferase involved in cell wall biosynthesis
MSGQNPFRILFLTPSVRLLGARQSLLSIVRNLPSGIDPLVVCSGVGELNEELRQSGVPCVVVRHHPWRKLIGRVRCELEQMPRLRQIVRSFQPDVIHCNEYHCTPQGLRGGLSSAKPCAVVTHLRSAIPNDHLVKYEVEQVHSIVAVSRSFAPQMENAGLAEKLEIVYNGIPVEDYESRREGRHLREELGWGETDFVVGILGLISPNKQQLLLAEAVALANQQGVPMRLLIAGDAFKSTTEYGDQLRQRLSQSDLRDKAAWLPFQRDVSPVYRTMNLNALISLEEGFGRTIIEAAAFGIPSVGSNRGGIPEIIRHQETGFVVPVEEPQPLVEALCEAAKSREKTASIGTRANGWVRENFTLDATMQKLQRVWAKAVEKARLQKLSMAIFIHHLGQKLGYLDEIVDMLT